MMWPLDRKFNERVKRIEKQVEAAEISRQETAAQWHDVLHQVGRSRDQRRENHLSQMIIAVVRGQT